MFLRFSFTRNFAVSFKACFKSLIVLIMIFAMVTESLADVCVWRDPEKTMSKLFPTARDYKTIDRKISPEKRQVIEQRLGRTLDPGEREDWNYYRLTDDKGQPLGFVIADAEKGEYGVIEVVMGITTDGKVKAVYVQKARERNKEFKSPEFLAQFAGKTHKDGIQIGKDIRSAGKSRQIGGGLEKSTSLRRANARN